MALKGKQKKLDKNNNNRIDAQDFKMLRAGKNKGGMFKGYTAPFETGASKGSSGTSTIVGVKPNAKLKGAAKRKKYRSMAEMRAAKGFKPGESASAFNKRQMLKKEALKAAKASRIGKIVAPIALAGVGAVQYLKSKMKNKKEEPKKKMGGGMMRPMGYREGGTLGPTPGAIARKRRKPKKNLEDRAYEAGVSNVFSNFRQGLKKAEKKYASIPSGMKKDPDTDADIKIKLIKSSRKDPFKEMDDSRREVFATERMGGGMMNKPMGYKAGKSVMAKGCKLGRKKPTKMY